MNTTDAINQNFTREGILNILASYELYYQIALGNFVYETLQDIDETNKKLEELNLQPLPSVLLSNIYDLILQMEQKEDFQKQFDYYIRYRATLQALQEFTDKDKDLLQIDNYIKEKNTLIHNDTFFTDTMYTQFENDYLKMYDYFNLLYDEDLTDQIKEEFLEKHKE